MILVIFVDIRYLLEINFLILINLKYTHTIIMHNIHYFGDSVYFFGMYEIYLINAYN